MRGVTRRELLAAAATGTVAPASGAKGVTGQSGGDAAWPMHQRDAANTGVAASGAGPAGPVAPRWTVTPGDQLWAGPVVADGTVYVGVDDEDVALVALDARDGTERWRYKPGEEVTTTPAVVDGTVYVPLQGGADTPGVVALTATDGSVRWRAPTNVLEPGLTVHRGTVYARDRERCWALDAATGSVAWTFDAETRDTHSPAIAGDTAFFGGVSGTVHALNTQTGDERWRVQVPGRIDSAPTVADGTVFVESGSVAGKFSALDAATGDEQWHATMYRHAVGSPAVGDGAVFVPTVERWIYAFEAADGTRRWRVRNPGVFKSSPAVVDDTVYVGSVDNSLYGLATDDGSIRWQHELSDWVTTSPAVVDGTVYVGSRDGTLYALEHWERSLPVLGVGIGGLAAAGIAAGYGILRDSTDD